MIRRSGYAQDKAVKAVADKVNAQIGVDLAQQEVNRQIAWLEKNFEALFRTNYPTFAGSELVQPRAVLLKKSAGTGCTPSPAWSAARAAVPSSNSSTGSTRKPTNGRSTRKSEGLHSPGRETGAALSRRFR